METLETSLEKLRRIRKFNVDNYIELKIKKINDFFKENHLDSAVIGISGGIDSALLVKASQIPNSPIKSLLPLNIPIHGDGTSNQLESEYKANVVVHHFGYSRWLIDLTKVYEEMVKTCEVYSTCTPWANGQMASVLRTPTLYFHAAILQTQGYKSIVCGTINRDEGAFLGYYGKASDAMVDLQVIADLHKSEVYKVAEYLEIPKVIIEATPTGDVYDGRTDLEMIGVNYDMVELFTLLCEYREYDNFILSNEELDRWTGVRNKILDLHYTNEHKYEVGHPAHFIDVMPRKVNGGWN